MNEHPSRTRLMMLAIDPGNVQSGYVSLLDGEIRKAGVVENSMLKGLLCDHFYYGMADALGGECDFSDVPRKRVAIEGIQALGMPVGKEVFDTCRWIGRLEQICDTYMTPAQIVYRRDIKLHFCGQARAKDQNIRAALIDRLGKPGTKANKGPTYGITSHAWSALAVALYALDNPEAT